MCTPSPVATADSTATVEAHHPATLMTAPTGHTLLLLDAAEAYHREIERRAVGVPEAVRSLLPHLRDPSFTHVLIVTLPEATPVHEAMHLERDLARAGVHPMAWVLNQCLTPLSVTDPTLRARRAFEARFLDEVGRHSDKVVIIPWTTDRSAVRTPAIEVTP